MTGSTSQDSDACVIHGNRVFGNMGLQSGVMVSSRRISRACSKAKYQGKRRAGRKRSRGAPQFIMRAGFGEAALANMSKGKTYLIFL